jgi:tetratricopeptide (TPR) repeat protein
MIFGGWYRRIRQDIPSSLGPTSAAQQALESGPNDGFRTALADIQERQYPEAITILESMRARGQATPDVNRLLAQAYEGNHQARKALDVLQASTKQFPRDERNYVELAALCMNLRLYDAGLKVLDVGLGYLPDNGQLLMERGVLYALRGRLDPAEQDYQRAMQVSPDLADRACAGLALAYLQNGKTPHAIRLLRRRIKNKPKNAFLLFLLGDALLRSGVHKGDPPFAEAQTALERSVKLDSHNASARIDLARIYLREDRVDVAITQLDHARKINPQDIPVYARLATAYRRKGDNERARAMLEKVKKLNENKHQQDMRSFDRARPTEMSLRR